MKNNVAYFIASYGKPINTTYELLKKHDANYPVHIVIGTDDPKLEEYKETYDDKTLCIFDKKDYSIDGIGHYITSDKICTYSRLAVDKFAKDLGYQYVVYMFDDILSFSLRYYEKGVGTKGVRQFNIDKMIDMYIKLLNSSSKINLVGPPNSSFYIGVNEKTSKDYSTRYGNMFIYNLDDNPNNINLCASVLEDMDICLQNNKIGNMSICPYGLQVNCRQPKMTKDSYNNISILEYYAQLCIKNQSLTVNLKNPTIHYTNFLPKIIDKKYKNSNTQKQLSLF